jgi:hypothetical protein
MHSIGFSGAYCITRLVMRAGASERSEPACRQAGMRANAVSAEKGFLDGEWGSLPAFEIAAGRDL